MTLPSGVSAGQKIHVQAPDGRLNEIIVPDGFGPGSTFTVEFADAPKQEEQYQNTAQTAYPTASATPEFDPSETPPANSNHDDGFATGFNNPSFVPSPAPATATASYDTNSGGGNYTPYVSASDARPVYSPAPTYPATTY